MKKRFIPTIIALILFVILAIYLNKYEVDEVLSPGEVKPVSILGCKQEDIKSISIGKGGNYDLKFELDSDKSKIVMPKEYSCENAEAFGIAKHFAELKSEYLFTDNATDTKIFGFNETSPSVKIQTASSVIELTLGNKIPVGTSLYLKKTNDPAIYIVPPYIKGSFEKSLDDLRNRALYFENFGTCNEINYTCGSDSISLVFDQKNSEWIIQNSKYLSDNVVVANLINNMRNLRISKFEDGDVSDDKYGLNPPDLKINIKNINGNTYELIAGNLQGADVYVSSDGKTVQRANNLKVDELRLEFNDFRDKFLNIFPFTDLTEIEVRDATGTINIVKKDKDWLYGEITIKESNIKEFVLSLSRTKVNDFLEKQDLENLGLNDTENCSKIVLKTKDCSKTFWLGIIHNNSLFMMDDEEMIRINPALDESFKKFMLRIRNANLEIIKQ